MAKKLSTFVAIINLGIIVIVNFFIVGPLIIYNLYKYNKSSHILALQKRNSKLIKLLHIVALILIYIDRPLVVLGPTLWRIGVPHIYPLIIDTIFDFVPSWSNSIELLLIDSEVGSLLSALKKIVSVLTYKLFHDLPTAPRL